MIIIFNYIFFILVFKAFIAVSIKQLLADIYSMHFVLLPERSHSFLRYWIPDQVGNDRVVASLPECVVRYGARLKAKK